MIIQAGVGKKILNVAPRLFLKKSKGVNKNEKNNSYAVGLFVYNRRILRRNNVSV